MIKLQVLILISFFFTVCFIQYAASENIFDKARRAKDLSEKIMLLNKALENEPNNHNICFELGIAYYQKGEADKSDYYLSRAVTLKKLISVISAPALKSVKEDVLAVTDAPANIEKSAESEHTVIQKIETPDIQVIQNAQIKYEKPNVNEHAVSNGKTDEENESATVGRIPTHPQHHPAISNDAYLLSIIQQIIKDRENESGNFEGKYDLNKITENDMKQINGLTEIDKVVILHYRELYGNYYSVDDLAQLPGLAGKMNILKQIFYVPVAVRLNPTNKSLAQLRAAANQSVVNLNKASSEEIIAKLGISALEAAMIVKYRERYGNFKNKEELRKIPIVGEKFDEIINKITVD